MTVSMKNQLKSGGTGSRPTPAPSSPDEKLLARNRLQERGITVDEERLFKYVNTGDVDTVKLLLAAGISPQARNAEGTEAVVLAALGGHQELVTALLAQGAQTTPLVKALESAKKSRKDRWDKLTSLSSLLTFTSTLLIATVGGLYTYLNNQRQVELLQLQQERDLALKKEQNRVVELQTVEKMIPHLVANEQQKRAALIAISALASPELAAKMGQAFGGTGAVQALESIATTNQEGAPAAVSALTAMAANAQASEEVQNALGAVFRAKQDSVVSILGNGRMSCTGFVANADKGVILTTRYCLDELGEQALAVRTLQGQTFPATPLRGKTEPGVGVLRISEHLPALAIASTPLAIGERVVALGEAPLHTGGLVGEVRRIQRLSLTEHDWRPIPSTAKDQFIVLEAIKGSAYEGTAGGPILDSKGEVVCMTHSIKNTSEWCVSAQALTRALKAL